MSRPNFPVEIWRHIFRQATFTPVILDTEWNYYPEEILWAGNAKGLEEPGTKYAIVRVCREWRDIGMEYLWEDICFPMSCQRHHMERLVEIFKSSATEFSAGYGWWTKRIICMGRQFEAQYAPVLPIMRFLEQLHNLHILQIAGNEPPASTRAQLANILQTRFNHSLRRLDARFDYPGDLKLFNHEDSDRNGMSSFFSRLAFFSVRIDSGLSSNTPIPPYFADLTALHLTLAPTSTYPRQWHCPRLRTLNLNYHHHSVVPSVVELTMQHRMTLHHLRIVNERLTRSSGLEQIVLTCICAAKQLRSFTADQATIGYLGRLTRGKAWVVQNASIAHLGVLFVRRDEFYKRLRSGIRLVGVGKTFTNVEAVRLLWMRFPDTLKEEEQEIWKGLSDRCKRRGVRLEDEDGRSLHRKDDFLYAGNADGPLPSIAQTNILRQQQHLRSLVNAMKTVAL